MFIRALKQVDLLPAFEILSQYDLPTSALDIDNLEGFWVAEEEGRIIGVGGIDLKKHVGLVRLIAVDKYYQGEGVGKTLYDNIEEYARNMRAIDLYLLTTIAEQYFNKLGYEAIERDLAPLPIQKSTQFIALCPQSVTLMQKSLNLVQGRREFDTGLFCAESILTTVAEYYGEPEQST
ncbi:MAG: GNAT family N-acetyltransferase [Bacteroidota bacterium]